MFLDTIRSLRWADYLYNSMLDPRSLARSLSQFESPLIKTAFIFPVLFAAVEIVSSAILYRQTMFFSVKITFGWIMLSIVNIFLVFFLAWLIETFLQLSGRAGNLRAEVSLVNFLYFPMLFLLPIVVFFNTIGFAPVFFKIIAYMGLSVWTGVNLVRGISELHGISFARALAVCLVPFSIMVILVIIMMILMAFSIVGFFVTM
jgi:hypothetical protein